MNSLLFFLLSLTLPSWSLRLTDAVSPQMEGIESGETLSPDKYTVGQYDSLVQALSRSRERIRVMSYNMLANTHEEELELKNRWNRRLNKIAVLVQESKPDIIGTQELHDEQVRDLLELIGDIYAFYGRGASDGQVGGEINGVFYRKDRFRPVDCRTLWLSPTPDQPGPNPFSPVSRTLSCLHLSDNLTGRTFALLNTHLAFASANAREYGARLIATLAAHQALHGPVIVTGDFNLFPNRPDLRILPSHDGEWIHQILTSGPLQDAADISVLGHLGPYSTYTNSGKDVTPFVGTGEPGVRLDRIYVSPQVCVLLHATESARVDGSYPSDHMPVVADVVLWN